MPRPSLDEIFAAKPVELYHPATEEARNAAIADIYAPQDNRPSLSQIFGAPKKMSEKVSSGGVARTALEQSLQGSTFGFSDEVTDRIGALVASKVTGLPYEELLQEARVASKARMSAQMEENPGTTIAANLAGALLTGGAGASTKAGTALANSLRSGNIAARVGKGAAAGAASGGLYGAGASDEGARIEGAGQGAALGTVLGGAVPVVGAAIKKGASKAIESFANRSARKAAQATGEVDISSISPEMKKVFARIRADFPDDQEFDTALNSYASKEGKTLVEAGGKRTANLAEGSAMYPSGSARAGEFFDEAVGRSPEKIKTVLSKTVSPNVNYYDTLDDVVRVGRENAAPIYRDAFKANPSVNSPVIDKILATPEGKSALGEAVKNIQNEMSLVAKPDKELTALAKEVSDLGLMDKSSGGVASGLKLRALDYVKKSMDDTINKAYRAGDEAEARRIISLKKALVSEIDSADKSGLYAKARAASGDYLSNKSAMDSGLDFLKEDAEVIKRSFKEFGKAEKESYKVGVVKSIRNSIDNKIDGRNVTEIFQRPATRQKLQSILSPKEYQKLMGEVKATDNIFKLKNQITGNSRTILRKIAAEEFDSAGQEFIADAAQNGLIRTTIKNGIQMVKRSFDGMNDKMASDVADILYESDPKKKYQIVKQLVNQANYEGEGIRKTEAAKKLAAYYSISEKIAKQKSALAPVIAGAKAGEVAKERKPTKLTITPRDKGE